MRMYLRFPGGKAKALTLSYDDGVIQDVRLMGLLDQYGIKCTFNLNSGLFAQEDGGNMSPLSDHRMTATQALSLYCNSRHEIAAHGKDHTFLDELPADVAISEVWEDRKALETMFGGFVRGFAYPFGTYNQQLCQNLEQLGIAYARTVKATEDFALPDNWYCWHPTCHHDHPQMLSLAQTFTEMDACWNSKLFYLWGHSFEFDQHDNWIVIEDFCKIIGNRKDIWYATNIEICDYAHAFHQLRISADGKTIHNPTEIHLWADFDGTIREFPPAETVTTH